MKQFIVGFALGGVLVGGAVGAQFFPGMPPEAQWMQLEQMRMQQEELARQQQLDSFRNSRSIRPPC